MPTTREVLLEARRELLKAMEKINELETIIASYGQDWSLFDSRSEAVDRINDILRGHTLTGTERHMKEGFGGVSREVLSPESPCPHDRRL